MRALHHDAGFDCGAVGKHCLAMRYLVLISVLLCGACTKEGPRYVCYSTNDPPNPAKPFKADSKIGLMSGELVSLHARDANGFGITIDGKNSPQYSCKTVAQVAAEQKAFREKLERERPAAVARCNAAKAAGEDPLEIAFACLRAE